MVFQCLPNQLYNEHLPPKKDINVSGRCESCSQVNLVWALRRMVKLVQRFNLYSLNEFIEYYKQRNTTIYVTFLDSSKAFDRIDHWLLFKKLIGKHAPLFII